MSDPGGYGGMPAGVLVTVEGKTIYHTGDTGLFGDLKLIGEMNTINVALIPIGDNFTMGMNDAVKAVEFLRPQKAIPMHYQTFDVIDTDPNKIRQIQNVMDVQAILGSGTSPSVLQEAGIKEGDLLVAATDR